MGWGTAGEVEGEKGRETGREVSRQRGIKVRELVKVREEEGWPEGWEGRRVAGQRKQRRVQERGRA